MSIRQGQNGTDPALSTVLTGTLFFVAGVFGSYLGFEKARSMENAPLQVLFVVGIACCAFMAVVGCVAAWKLSRRRRADT